MDDNEFAAKWAKLKLISIQGIEAVKANPLPYLDRCLENRYRLEDEMRELREAAYPNTPETLMAAENAGRPELKPLDLVTITREDYDCLIRLRHLLNENRPF